MEPLDIILGFLEDNVLEGVGKVLLPLLFFLKGHSESIITKD